MKKTIAKVVACVMVAGMLLAGCGKSEEEKVLLEMPVERAEDILIKVWGCYDEEDKFDAYGGDVDSMAVGFPCEFNLESVDELQTMYGVPEEAIALLDNAASLVDEMDSYDFTVAAYQLTKAGDMNNFRSLVKDSIMEKDWGEDAPEKLLIATLDEVYVIVAFGEEDRIDTFEKQLKYATEAEVVTETDWD